MKRIKQAAKSPLPLSLVIRIDCTNGTTMLDGLEAVRTMLLAYRFPKKNQVIKDTNWKVTVLDAILSLEERAKRDDARDHYFT